MKIGIIGLGFVGDAIHNSFLLKGLESKMILYDKFKDGGIGTFEQILKAGIVFLCLPTLYDEKSNSYDISSIHETCQKLKEKQYDGIVIIKSTVEPGITEELANQYGLKFIHNPEFLTARTAREDFHNQTHIVLGRSSTCSEKELERVVEFYQEYYPQATISKTDCTSSESMKIFCNSFYAMKISIFNEFYLHCQKLGIEYNGVVELMLKNDWINPMHTTVPGPDGKLGYGGACFPKDTKALLAQMHRLESEHRMLEASVEENEKIRK